MHFRQDQSVARFVLSLIKGNIALLAEHGHQHHEAGTQVSESLESVSDRHRLGALDSSDEHTAILQKLDDKDVVSRRLTIY
jgi:hypothetical protein